ncbi:LOW QUALITY PROTEIN: hypothetical protein ACHAXT_001282 [Thalassiosira profunda]
MAAAAPCPRPRRSPSPRIPLPARPSEDVYAALIRQYLDLLCLENATFLAERYAASFPRSEPAIYLLAHCYYRAGRPKAARAVLLDKWLGRNDSLWGAGGDDEADAELERTRNAARYLLARCCCDLGHYTEAEESLLRHAREQFAQAVSDGGGTINGAKIEGSRNDAMDAWILHKARRGEACPVPRGAAGLQLLGRICARSNRRKRAGEYYRLALALDPLLWTSYAAFWACRKAGEEAAMDDPGAVFGVPAPALSPRHVKAGLVGGAQHGLAGVGTGGGGDATDANAVDQPPGQLPEPSSLASFQLNRHGTPATPYTSFGDLHIGTESSRGVNFHLPPSTAAAKAGGGGGRPSLPQTNLFAATPAVPETPAGTTEEETPARSAGGSALGHANRALDRARRVVAGLAYAPSPESGRRPGGTAARTTTAGPAGEAEITFPSTPLPSASGKAPAPFAAGVSTVKGEKRALFATTEEEAAAGAGARKKTPKKADPPRKDQMEGTEERKEEVQLPGETASGADDGAERRHVETVLELLSGLGAAYRCLCRYRSREALELFRALPPEHVRTGWVQHQIGRAHFEMADYRGAHRALRLMQKVEPYRMQGLDVLSTTLRRWSCRTSPKAAVDFDRTAPEAWFAVGNCFSLQKEHETAISFFRRAIQLDPAYTSAHTLCGHEFLANEDFEKATACYRDAIRVDPRHYNAWYGLGAIFFRQEKADVAEYHFQRALDVNPQSSVLHCHLGLAQFQNGRAPEALDTLAGAFRLDPRNPQAHYQRATIFMALDRPEDALSELEKVRCAAPREASVHFNMGKVYKRLGRPEKAMMCFLTALDLDPKDNNLIKAAMDRLDEPDIEEEVSVF